MGADILLRLLSLIISIVELIVLLYDMKRRSTAVSSKRRKPARRAKRRRPPKRKR